jgi:hypothetical protein
VVANLTRNAGNGTAETLRVAKRTQRRKRLKNKFRGFTLSRFILSAIF